MDGSHLSVHGAASGIPSAGHLGVPSVGQVGFSVNLRPSANGERDDDDCHMDYPAQSTGQLPEVSALPSTSVHTVPFNLPNASSAQHAGHNHTPVGRLNRPNEPFSMIFRKKYERLDWRKIASIDLEKIYKTQDTRALQDNLTQMAFFDLEEELRCVGVNPQFEKLFQTMQLSLEYLLYVQDHLQREMDSIKGASAILIKRQTDAIKKFEHEAEDLKAQLQSSKDELKRRKKMMVAQQEIINSAAKGNYHRCPMCEKAFIERGYLETHFRKRHPNSDIKMLGTAREQQFTHDHQCSPTNDLQNPHTNQPCGSVRSDFCTPELVAARDRIRELEKMLSAPPSTKTAVPEPPQMPLQVLDMYNKQRDEMEHLRSSLVEFQSRYFESEKTLVELRKDYQHLTDKVHEAQTSSTNQQQRQSFQQQMQQLQSQNQERPQSPNPMMMDMIERRVNGVQEAVERRLVQSEESWKDKLVKVTEQHTRDLKDLEREMALKAQEQQTVHKAEKLRLQMQNDEQERRIREMENQYNNQRAQPRKEAGSGAFQIQVHTNRQSTAGSTKRKPMTPRVSAAMNNYPEIMDELRDELNEALSKKLEEYGVPRGATKVTDRDKDEIFSKLRREHTQLQGKLAKFGAARSTIENHLKGKIPAQYSSSELLDEASKIRVRKRSGRQVVESGSNQKVTEITTYDIRPARSSELDLARQQAVPADSGENENAPNIRRVSFRAAKDRSPVPSPRSARTEPPDDQGAGPPQYGGNVSQPNVDIDFSAPRKNNDGAWFSDEDSH